MTNTSCTWRSMANGMRYGNTPAMWRNGVKKSKLLDDAVYEKEANRLSGLAKYPALPAAQKELRRALRRISEFDEAFIHRLITDVVDDSAVCPTPADLIRMAGERRSQKQTSTGKADCLLCGGSGFVRTVRKVSLPGIAPYDAECSAVCQCRGGK